MTTMWRTGSRACGTTRWMPRVRWSRAPASAPARPRTSSTHGPAAFTTIRPCARMLRPVNVSRRATSPPAISIASTWFTHSAPAACAPSTVSSTRRASQVWYSMKVAAPWRRVPSSVGSRARASSRLHIACRSSGATVAMRSKVQRPRPSFACPARPWVGITMRTGSARWGARRRSTLRSVAASRTRPTPPWISFELRLEVPAAQSRRSTSATRSPRSAASRATPAPVMPPPMTRRSSAAAGRAARVASRVSGENGEAMAARDRLAGRAQLAEGGLRLGDLVGAALLARDLERARGEGERLLAVAPRLAHVGERQARGERVRVTQEHLAEHRLALHAVPAEQAREADEERPLRGHRIDVVRVELERAVELHHQAAELEDLGEILAVEPHQLAQVAEEGEVRVGAVVVERDGALGDRLAAVEVRLARRSIRGAAAAFALGARAGGEAGDRVVGGADHARQAEAGDDHEEPPGAGGAHGSRDHAYRAARSQLFSEAGGRPGPPRRATRVYRPVCIFGHPTGSGAAGGIASTRHRRCTRRAMAIFPRKPRRPSGRPVAPEGPGESV